MQSNSTNVTIKCEFCGKDFSIRRMRQGAPKTCSLQCYFSCGKDKTPLADRFFKYVGKKQANGCVLWTGATNGAGYGVLGINRRPYRASRISYELFVQPIPDGLCALHDCPSGDNPLCVNPMHLWLGDRTQNMSDKVAKDRQIKGSKCYQAKLTELDVHAIRCRFSDGDTATKISEDYNVHRRTISDIVNGKTWKHV